MKTPLNGTPKGVVKKKVNGIELTLRSQPRSREEARVLDYATHGGGSLKDYIRDYRRDTIAKILKLTDGNIEATAQVLGYTKTELNRYIVQYAI